MVITKNIFNNFQNFNDKRKSIFLESFNNNDHYYETLHNISSKLVDANTVVIFHTNENNVNYFFNEYFRFLIIIMIKYKSLFARFRALLVRKSLYARSRASLKYDISSVNVVLILTGIVLFKLLLSFLIFLIILFFSFLLCFSFYF